MTRKMDETQFSRIWTYLTLGLVLGLLLAAPALADGDRHPDDINWYGGFGGSSQDGLDGLVHCSIIFEGKLVVGGSFTSAGGSTVNHVAAWDGAGWAPLGDGFDASVYALEVHDGQLYAGGPFMNSGSTTVNFLAVWNGTDWIDVDQGLNGVVYALISHDDYLWIGGSFDGTIADSYAACKVIRWDGADWVGAGATTGCLSGEILCFAVYQFPGEAAVLAVGGSFNALGDNPCEGVAYWAEDNWLQLGDGVDGTVFDMVGYDNKLLMGGDFSIFNDPSINYLGLWNGVSWDEPLDADLPDQVVRSLEVDGTTLYIGGDFLNIGAMPIPRVASFDGTDWSALTDNCPGSVRTLLYDETLFVGGDFAISGGADVDYIGALASQEWTPLTAADLGANNVIYSICDYDGELVVSGSFTAIGGEAVSYLAAFDGTTWHALGAGVDADVYDLHIWDNKLIATGNFANAGGAPASKIAAWDGSSWSTLGDGLDNWGWKMVTHDGDLIVGGNFMNAGGVAARRIASWDGAGWSAVGAGFTDTCYGLASHGALLYATGDFDYTITSTPLHKIGAWDGSSWAPLAGGLTSGGFTVGYDLAIYEDELYLAGRFTEIDGVTSAGFAKWSGTAWVTYGVGVYAQMHDPYCKSLCVYRDRLAVGGSFEKAWGTVSGDIAFWDGEEFWALGSAFTSDISHNVGTLHVFNDLLYLGGNFREVAGKPSYYIARWGDDWVPVLLGSFSFSQVDLGVRLDWEVSSGSEDFQLRLVRTSTSGEKVIPFTQPAPGIFSALDESPELMLGGQFTYTLSGTENGEDWLILRSEDVSLERISRPASFVGTFPNPFNPKTTLRLVIPTGGPAKLSIYDLSGRLVQVLHSGELSQGVHDFIWLGVDDSGTPMTSGIYHARLTTEGHSETRKLVLVR
jgi:trimeric autotransporter adhesin